jgi:hypothetical protein
MTCDQSDNELRRVFAELGFIALSEPMVGVLRQASKAACLSDITVLLEGETGTGKQVLAHAIHRLDQKRGTWPFVTVHCGSLSETLAESELFGHQKGAFTGAFTNRKGCAASPTSTASCCTPMFASRGSSIRSPSRRPRTGLKVSGAAGGPHAFGALWEWRLWRAARLSSALGWPGNPSRWPSQSQMESQRVSTTSGCTSQFPRHEPGRTFTNTAHWFFRSARRKKLALGAKGTGCPTEKQYRSNRSPAWLGSGTGPTPTAIGISGQSRRHKASSGRPGLIRRSGTSGPGVASSEPVRGMKPAPSQSLHFVRAA